MNIPWPRLIDGLIESLETHVLLAVDDGFARGQVVGVVGALHQIRQSAGWLAQPLAEQVEAQAAALEKLREAASALEIALPAPPLRRSCRLRRAPTSSSRCAAWWTG